MPNVDVFSLNLLRYSQQVFYMMVTVCAWQVSTVLMHWMNVDVQGISHWTNAHAVATWSIAIEFATFYELGKFCMLLFCTRTGWNWIRLVRISGRNLHSHTFFVQVQWYIWEIWKENVHIAFKFAFTPCEFTLFRAGGLLVYTAV